jgi:hypothetical protein
MPHLFVYGTLVDPRQLDAVLGHPHGGERLRACLHDYQRVSVPGFEYSAIVQTQGERVDGILVMDLSEDDLRVLDLYEEVQSGFYSRACVEVDAWGCGPRPIIIAAQTYVAGPHLQRLLASSAAHTTSSTAT